MEKLLENFSKNSRTQWERVRERESRDDPPQYARYAIFENIFETERAANWERSCGGCRVRNVKVHCFIEENGEKLFGRADAKLSNSLLVEKIRRVFEKCKKQRAEAEAEAGDAAAALLPA